MLIVGVVIGGLASWLRQGKWRGTARRLERELQQLARKLAVLEGAAAKPTIIPEAGQSAAAAAAQAAGPITIAASTKTLDPI